MADDPFDDLLDLEDEFYKEGFEAGVADSTYAGMIEGKVFGMEKGYEKAFELAKLHGRALVWNARISESQTGHDSRQNESKESMTSERLPQMQAHLEPLRANTRLQKHIESLLGLTDGRTLSMDNTDEAVTEFDDRLVKARAKAKVIANIAGEPVGQPVVAGASKSGIEDSPGPNARR